MGIQIFWQNGKLWAAAALLVSQGSKVAVEDLIKT